MEAVAQTREEFVSQTWEEMGRHIKARNNVVFVRTRPAPIMTDGGILIPDAQRSFYNGLPNPGGGNNPKLVWATVLSVSDDGEVSEGDDVLFMRLDFAWIHKCSDRTLVGWVKEESILLVETKDE